MHVYTVSISDSSEIMCFYDTWDAELDYIV